MAPGRLKRVLGLFGVTFIAVGFTIGGGIFVLTGIVLKITGPALPLAFALAVIPVFLSMLPLAMLGSALPATGGNYRYPSRMVSPALAFVGVWTYVLTSFFGQIPLYALACGRYAHYFAPRIPVEFMAVAILSAFLIVNLMGVRLAATVQGLMVIVLIGALIYYATCGLVHLESANFEPFFPKGAGGFLLGVALLTFTYFGANGIIELGGEIRDPGRVIPRALFIAFPLIVAVYVLVATATVGALPWEQTAAQSEPLIMVGEMVLSRGGLLFFLAGGAILALTTTLNALFIVGTKSLLAMVDDGILPQALGRVNRRFSTPHVLLILIWALSVAGVLTGFSLETFASYAALGGMLIFVPVLLAAWVLPRRYPAAWRASRFRLKGFWLWFCPLTGCAMVAFFGSVILVELRSPLKIALFLGFIASGVLFYRVRRRQLRGRGIDLDDIRHKEDWLDP